MTGKWKLLIWCVFATGILILAACGGDDVTQGDGNFAHMMSNRAEMSTMSVPAARSVSHETTLDWAEYKFPDLFPKYSVRNRYPDIEYGGMTLNARSYEGEWGIRWLAVDTNQRIFGLGDYTDNFLMSFEDIDYWSDQIMADLFTITVDDRIASEVDPSDYYLVNINDASKGYPESYLESATTQEEIAIYPCQLEVENIAYPKSWLGNHALPDINGAPLDSSILRGIALKDIHLEDNPAFLGDITLPGNPSFNGDCSGDLAKEFERTFDRLVNMGADYVQVTQWHWAGIREDGSWYVYDTEDTYSALSDELLEAFVSAAHDRGLKVLTFNQIQAVVENNQPYVPTGNLENYQKWLDAFAPFMRSRAAYFESIGIDLWEMGCSVCMYWDSGDGSPEANELFANAYSSIIDDVKKVYTGQTYLNVDGWLYDRPDILSKLDFLSTRIWPGIETLPDSFNAEIYRDGLFNSWWAGMIKELDLLGKPIIVNFGNQSRSNLFNVPGYVEVVQCTASEDDIFDIDPHNCVQRDMQPDFSLQAIVTEGSFEALNDLNLSNLKMVMIGDYWQTDSMYSKDRFPNLGSTFRNKPAEGVIQQWFARP